jgi:hypothetical protein
MIISFRHWVWQLLVRCQGMRMWRSLQTQSSLVLDLGSHHVVLAFQSYIFQSSWWKCNGHRAWCCSLWGFYHCDSTQINFSMETITMETVLDDSTVQYISISVSVGSLRLYHRISFDVNTQYTHAPGHVDLLVNVHPNISVFL